MKIIIHSILSFSILVGVYYNTITTSKDVFVILWNHENKIIKYEKLDNNIYIGQKYQCDSVIKAQNLTYER